MYTPLTPALIGQGVLVALCAYAPLVKPLNRLLPSQWNRESLREINNTLNAIDLLLFAYNEAGRNEELPIKELSHSQLTGWICDVLHGQ